MKKKWSEWAVDMIKSTGRCPGDGPSIGSATDVMTESEFVITVKANGSHKYDDCHHASAILGLDDSYTLKELNIKHDDKVIDKTREMAGDFEEVKMSKMLALLRERLHSYINRIHFQKDGSISIPEPLIKLEEYIKRYFDR